MTFAPEASQSQSAESAQDPDREWDALFGMPRLRELAIYLTPPTSSERRFCNSQCLGLECSPVDAKQNALAGRVAIITGVSRRKGIGFAIARRLSALGADLFLHSFAAFDASQPWGADPDGPVSLVDELRRQGVRVEHEDADFQISDAPDSLVFSAVVAFGCDAADAKKQRGWWQILVLDFPTRHSKYRAVPSKESREFLLTDGGDGHEDRRATPPPRERPKSSGTRRSGPCIVEAATP